MRAPSITSSNGCAVSPPDCRTGAPATIPDDPRHTGSATAVLPASGSAHQLSALCESWERLMDFMLRRLEIGPYAVQKKLNRHCRKTKRLMAVRAAHCPQRSRKLKDSTATTPRPPRLLTSSHVVWSQ
jgi:hypothetical protein